MTPLAQPTTAEIFTIPAADWTAINKRVGTVSILERYEPFVSKTLPGFPALVASSALWASTTYDGLVNQSRVLADYAGRAISTFGDLSAAVKQVPGGRPLHPRSRSERPPPWRPWPKVPGRWPRLLIPCLARSKNS